MEPTITRLDQITGEIAKLKWDHEASQPNPFNILLLSEGFTYADLGDFDKCKEELIDNFFKIPPFTYCKPYMNFFSWFGPSKKSGIPEGTWGSPDHETDPWSSVFKIFADKGYEPIKLSLWNPKQEDGKPLNTVQRVKEVLKKLQLPEGFETPDFLTNSVTEIWTNSLSKSFGAICIMANTKEYTNPLNKSFFNEGIPEADKDIRMFKYDPEWRFIVIDIHGFDPQSGQLGGCFYHVFAHELAHSFNLIDEYVKDKDKFGSPPKNFQNEKIRGDLFLNADYASDKEKSDLKGSLINRLKWKSLIASPELEKIKIFTREQLEHGHPEYYDLDPSDPSIGTGIETKFYTEIPDTSQKNHWSDIHLIEGSYYQHNFFRSNFECKMRHGVFRKFDEPAIADKFKLKTPSGTFVYGSPEFCRVCNYQIRHKITGYTESPGRGIDRNKLQLLFDSEVMPRIRKSFEIQNDNFKTDYSVAGPKCELASIRAYIVFKNLPSPLNIKFNVTPKHISLYYNGIVCDPTFYDMYRIGSFKPVGDADADSDITFGSLTGEGGTFKNWEIVRGKVGVLDEIAAYIYYRTMKKGSHANPVMKIPESTGDPIDDAIVIRIFIKDVMSQWYDEEPHLYRIYEWNEKQKNDINNVNDIGGFFKVMQTEWDRWLRYKKLRKEGGNLPEDKSLDHYIPLDMDRPLQYVLNL